tara:strand:+ start:3803 stop:4210 length:408 start_codon:yes stop_codon:yes gene_type:complete
MAKITISRLFEVSKYLTTDSGKELKDALVYLSEFVEVVIRNLRNGLTFEGNFDTQVKQVVLNPETETVILSSTTRRVKEVVVRQVISDTYYRLDGFGWKYNSEGNVVISAGFKDATGGSPGSNENVALALLIHFG